MSDEQANLTEQHALLTQFVGEWEGVTQVWFEPDTPPNDESPQQGTIRPILDGRFILHEYQGSMDGHPLQGRATYGYDPGSRTFQSVWLDTFHMGAAMMFLEGVSTEQGFSVLGSYLAGQDEEGTPVHWGWRTEISRLDENQIRITHYNRSPEGQEYKGVETLYTRKG